MPEFNTKIPILLLLYHNKTTNKKPHKNCIIKVQKKIQEMIFPITLS